MVGRSPAAILRIDDPYTSSEHAKITWTGSKWRLRDLGSRNGTFVDGNRLTPGQAVSIGIGSKIGFGADEADWEVSDVEPPLAMATELSSRVTKLAAGEFLVLPEDDAPELSIYPDPQGAGWVVEDLEGEVRPVEDQEVITVGASAFRLDLPVMSEATPMVDIAKTLENVTLRMAVSPDEETVEIKMMLRGVCAATLERREHGYLLLTLARARQEDKALPPDERGWRSVDELTRMFKIDRNALNVATHRARQQLAATGLEGAAGVVQTRRGQRRLGTERFEIVALEE